jgi:hypothetical protein
MTLRELSKDAVLGPLVGTKDERCARTQGLLAADARSSFTVADAPAALLRRNLETKFRIAKRGGMRIDGDAELLLALTDLGEELVTSVSTVAGGDDASVFFRSSTLEPIGCVLMAK